MSFYGLCITRERGTIQEGFRLCETALKKDPGKAENYLNLARIYLWNGLSSQAVNMLREGLKVDRDHPGILEELRAMGVRRRPLLYFLPRENRLNKYIGMVLSKFRLL
jgi:tetratricopeptide (TPR) repeat protein